MATGKIVFITGTDTGAGKTLLTAMLLHHLREQGVNALAMKPFCTGDRGDVNLLYEVQDGILSKDEINPYFFKYAAAPLVAARRTGKTINFREVLERIQGVQRRCDVLLIEGAGGVLVPCTEGLTIIDLVKRLGCPVVVAARNRLGVINHALLTVEALKRAKTGPISVVLMGVEAPDLTSRSNLATLIGYAGGIPVFSIPFLGNQVVDVEGVREISKKSKKTLARLLEMTNLTPARSHGGRNR